MSEKFEPVHEVDDYYDGPRAGLADYRGVPHRFRAIGTPESDDDRFELLPHAGNGSRVTARAVFRARRPVPDLAPGVMRPLEVQWTVETHD